MSEKKPTGGAGGDVGVDAADGFRLKGAGVDVGLVGGVPKILDGAEPGVGGDVADFGPKTPLGRPKRGGGVTFSDSSLALPAVGLAGRTAAAGLGVGGGF